MTTILQAQSDGEGATANGTCSIKPAGLPRAKPISVNGVAVPREAIAQETQNHPAGKPIEARLAAARALVVRELLVQEARRLAIEPRPQSYEAGRRETEEEALIRQLVEQEVAIPDADEAACRRIYDSQRAKFRSADLYGVRHILFTAAPDDRDARAQARGKADAAIAVLLASPQKFAELAAVHSCCPSRAQGGHLGQISRGQTVPEFEAALKSAPVGQVCPSPVESRYGFHVVLVEQRLEGKALPFEMAKAQIAEWLTARARHTAIRQYIGMLAGRADIVGIDIIAPSPLAVRQGADV